MRVLVTGAAGLLGSKLLGALRAREVDVHATVHRLQPPAVDGVTWRALDVTDRRAVSAAFAAARPAVVIHAAAMADVDQCEREPERAEAVNARGTAHVADACASLGARLIYLSTDYVFDGEAGPYREDDAPHPLSVYGRTKLAGEQAAAALPNAAICRTAVLFGANPGGRSNLVLWLLERLRRGEPAPAAVDQVGNPTWADNLAEMLAALTLAECRGVYHVAGATIIDRFGFCRLAAEVFGYDPALVQPIVSASIPRPARRPRQAGLVVERFRRDVPAVAPLTAREALVRLRAQLDGRVPSKAGRA